MRGAGRAAFVAILLLIAGTLNIVYGIGALDSANIFANDTRYIFTDLNTMGWVLIILGVVQLTGGFSLLVWQHLRPGDRHRRRHTGRDRGPVLDRRRQSLVVARRLRPLHLHPPRPLHPRRGRALSGRLSGMRSAQPLWTRWRCGSAAQVSGACVRGNTSIFIPAARGARAGPDLGSPSMIPRSSPSLAASPDDANRSKRKEAPWPSPQMRPRSSTCSGT